MNKDIKYYIKIAGMLFLICAITALIVAAVYGLTKDKIAENVIKTMNESISEIFGENISTEKLEYKGEDSSVIAIYAVSIDGSLQGYAVHVKPMGFKDVIEMMVGVYPNGYCKSVRIIALSETPGLGSKVDDDKFLSQFKGKGDVFEVKNNIEPIAGATVSSKAVAAGINTAIDAVNAISLGGEGTSNE